jgi:chemotaxis protein CheC
MILVFDEENGRALANRLLGREAPAEGQWSDLEQSALCETGNILVCAYMNALTRLLNTELVPTPPLFIQDFGASVLDQALMAQAACSDEILLCRTGFHSPAGDLGWNVLFVPTPEMRQALEQTLSRAD